MSIIEAPLEEHSLAQLSQRLSDGCGKKSMKSDVISVIILSLSFTRIMCSGRELKELPSQGDLLV